MPAGLSHYLFAKSVADELKKTHETISEGAVLFGAQMPDLLYLYTFLKKSNNNLGVYLHRNNSREIFENFRKNSESPVGDSFVYGYLTHYAFDIVVHPYVYWLQEQYLCEETRKQTSKFHFQIEADFDVFLYRKLVGEMDYSFPHADKSEPEEHEKLEIYLLLKSMFREVYHEDLEYRKYNHCCFNYKRFNRFKSDPFFWKRRFLLTAENVLHLKHSSSMLFQRRNPDERVLNSEHRVWFNPFDEDKRSDEDFFQLLDRAKETAIRLIGKYDRGEIDEEFDLHLLQATPTALFEN